MSKIGGPHSRWDHRSAVNLYQKRYEEADHGVTGAKEKISPRYQDFSKSPSGETAPEGLFVISQRPLRWAVAAAWFQQDGAHGRGKAGDAGLTLLVHNWGRNDGCLSNREENTALGEGA